MKCYRRCNGGRAELGLCGVSRDAMERIGRVLQEEPANEPPPAFLEDCCDRRWYLVWLFHYLDAPPRRTPTLAQMTVSSSGYKVSAPTKALPIGKGCPVSHRTVSVASLNGMKQADRFVTCLRVSTDHQGQSGLGLKTQRDAIGDIWPAAVAHCQGGRGGELLPLRATRTQQRLGPQPRLPSKARSRGA